MRHVLITLALAARTLQRGVVAQPALVTVSEAWWALARVLPAPCMALGGIAPVRLRAIPRRAAGIAAIGGLAPTVASLPQ